MIKIETLAQKEGWLDVGILDNSGIAYRFTNKPDACKCANFARHILKIVKTCKGDVTDIKCLVSTHPNSVILSGDSDAHLLFDRSETFSDWENLLSGYNFCANVLDMAITEIQAKLPRRFPKEVG